MEHCGACGRSGSCEKGCGGCGHCGGGGDITISLNKRQARLLAEFSQVPFLPLCCLCSEEGEREPWFLPAEALEWEGPIISQTLKELAAMGLISLDYDQKLTGYDYGEYDGLGLPITERGSMALTPLGQVVLEQLETF